MQGACRCIKDYGVPIAKLYETNRVWQDCNNVNSDYDTNDAVFGVRENIGSTSGPGGTTFMTETFEPAAGMNSFGESLNPVPGLGGTAGPGGTTYMTGRFDMPSISISPGDGSRCLV